MKNHFYSRLRKAVRKLNRIISDEFERSYGYVWMGSLYKILEISEGKFKNNSKYNEDLIDKCVGTFPLMQISRINSMSSNRSSAGREAKNKRSTSSSSSWNSISSSQSLKNHLSTARRQEIQRFLRVPRPRGSSR